MPIGVWSTSSTRSICGQPSIAAQPCQFGLRAAAVDERCRLASSTSRASVDLPEPLTPVTATSRCSGTATSTCCRLCSDAPCSVQRGALRVDRAARLQRVLQRVRQQPAGHRCGAAPTGRPPLPSATSVPPRLPAPGPMSMMCSARRIVSSSCSTTTSVLPLSLRCLQGLEQDAVVARVQADGRLVEHVAHALQVAAELRRQADALRFAAAQRGRGAVQRQVAEADFFEELEPARDLADDVAARCRLRAPTVAFERQRLDPLPRVADRPVPPPR